MSEKDAGDRTALTVKRDGTFVKWSYNNYLKDIESVAKAFISIGALPHHGVAIWGFNSPEWFISDIAAIFVGGMVRLQKCKVEPASVTNYIVKLFQSLPRAWYPAQYLLYLPITLLWNNALKLITWLTISNHCGLYQSGVITNLRNLLIRLAPKTVLSIIILQNCTFCSFWIPCKKVYDIIPFWLVSLSIKKGLSNSSQMEFF